MTMGRPRPGGPAFARRRIDSSANSRRLRFFSMVKPAAREKSAIADLKTLARVYETVLDRYFAA